MQRFHSVDAVPTRVAGTSRESEGYSDTHGDETAHSDPKLASPASLHLVQRVLNHSGAHENGFRSCEVEEEEDWPSGPRPSVHLSLAGATDKSDKIEAREEFFVPLDMKPSHGIEADITKSSRSPVDEVESNSQLLIWEQCWLSCGTSMTSV